MSMPSLDLLIIGQGLAGTALAWQSHWAGLQFAVIDRNEAVTSSKIAAGLMTPITGQRLTTSWRWSELWPVAIDFYRHVERVTRRRFFRSTSMVRTLANLDEIELIKERLRADDFYGSVRQPPQPELHPAAFTQTLGSFEMHDGGQLHVTDYLAASREFFQQQQTYCTADLDIENEIDLHDGGVKLPRLQLSAERLVFCQGHAGSNNRWFGAVPFHPAKGEILTVRIPGLKEDRVLHGGVWIAPIGDEHFRVGATYDWSRFDNIPTPEGRGEIETRLREWLRLPFTVEDHHAAVRPILRAPIPLLGFHPRWPQLGYFNGLASKGSLMAPFFARHLVRVMTGEETIDPTMDVGRRREFRA